MGIEAKLTWRGYYNGMRINYFRPGSTTLVGGFVYVVRRYEFKENIFVFSLATQTWRPFWRFIVAADHSAVLVNDKLYLVGGLSAGRPCAVISEIDFILGKMHQFSGDFPSVDHSAAYVEKRDEIIIYGKRSSTVCGFNVSSKQLTRYRIQGSHKPRVTSISLQSTVSSNGDIYVYDRYINNQSRPMHILTLRDHKTATWSTVDFGNGRPEVGLARMGTCVVDDMMVLFGGFRGFATKRELFLYDMRTGDSENLAENSLGSCTCEGSWPIGGGFSNAVVASRKIWFFGESRTQIYSLEIER